MFGTFATVWPGLHFQFVALPVEADADRYIDRSVGNRTFPNFQHGYVFEDHQVDRVQWAALPRVHVLHHRVGDFRNKVAEISVS